MSLLRTDASAGYVHADAEKLDRQLREGDGLLWAGDWRLELRMGLVTANSRTWVPQLKRTVNKGEVIARRYEVWRHCEDGVDRRIGTWRIEEFDRILMDLAPMRLDAPGRKDTLDAIDESNAAIERAREDKMHESLMETFEHALKLQHDRTQPRNVFRQMPGQRDESKSQPSDLDSAATSASPAEV